MIYTISISSNKQRKENLELARKRLSELFPGIRFSAEEETAPLYFRRPDLFSNQVARFMSRRQADEVTSRLKTIEQEAGRTSEEKKQEIVRLDLDLLACDSVIYKPEDLERDYVARGLKQLPRTPFEETKG